MVKYQPSLLSLVQDDLHIQYLSVKCAEGAFS